MAEPDRPLYMSRATLAAALDMSVSTVDEMVRRGVLPRPVRLSAGCVRWSWAAVEAALASLAGPADHAAADAADPYLAGVSLATKPEGNGDSAEGRSRRHFARP